MQVMHLWVHTSPQNIVSLAKVSGKVWEDDSKKVQMLRESRRTSYRNDNQSNLQRMCIHAKY